jgi:hypothetical protein
MPELNLAGKFYASFTTRTDIYRDADKRCIEETVYRLLSVQTSAEQPGMLLGKIQSGKTKTFLGAIALAFDNGFDIAIILTKGTKALTRQTLERVKRDFSSFVEQDRLQLFDIMTVPASLTGYELNQKLIFVSKKQSDNLDRLSMLFTSRYPQLSNKRILIIDDEADYASIGFRNTQQQNIEANRTTRQLEQLRTTLTRSAFLQVTATPYSLYLQPEDLVLNGVAFRPMKPAFTVLVPVNSEYIGSDYYFDGGGSSGAVSSFIYRPITQSELEILRQQDRRRFRLEDCLTSEAIVSLRRAICNFIVGACIRRLQDQSAKLQLKKYSFLFHTEAQRSAHTWQETVVTTLSDKLREAVNDQPELLRSLLTDSYNDLANSVRAINGNLPDLDLVLRQAFTALEQDWLMITKVNSERQVEELLDADGQLRLRTPLNVFIGGQILDRGVTIANLIGFFYGRRPQIYQQDTVLQHSRMFGFRPIEDIAVTRFYTEPAIHAAMRRMHESDVALRQTIERSPDQSVVFIQRDPAGRIRPCSPNKILVSNTTTLRPFKRILPVGFQTDVRTRVFPVVEEIDELLDQAINGVDPDQPVEISLTFALDLLQKIEPTLLMATDLGYQFDWEACRAALEYMSVDVPPPSDRNKVLCLVRKDRNLSRFQPALGPPFFSDAPDTAQREGAIARGVAINSPMLIMIRQNGSEGQGWRSVPFYWPVIMAQQNIQLAIFAHETAP